MLKRHSPTRDGGISQPISEPTDTISIFLTKDSTKQLNLINWVPFQFYGYKIYLYFVYTLLQILYLCWHYHLYCEVIYLHFSYNYFWKYITKSLEYVKLYACFFLKINFRIVVMVIIKQIHHIKKMLGTMYCVKTYHENISRKYRA